MWARETIRPSGLQAPVPNATSALATQLEVLTASLPTIAAKLEDVVTHQSAMEAKLAAGPTAPLAEPL